jgi:hypothetical protein
MDMFKELGSTSNTRVFHVIEGMKREKTILKAVTVRIDQKHQFRFTGRKTNGS